MATDGLIFLFDMGIFDFFNNKKNARQEQLRLQEEKCRAEEQRRLAERRKQEEQQRREESFLSNFEFDSTCHQRYENGQPVRELQVCPRYIKIKKNINGCSGYQLTPGDGYILTATNGDTGQPQFAPKPMRVVKISDSEILLKGIVSLRKRLLDGKRLICRIMDFPSFLMKVLFKNVFCICMIEMLIWNTKEQTNQQLCSLKVNWSR